MMDSMYLVLSMEFMLRKYDKQIFQCKYYCKYIATTSKTILNFKMVQCLSTDIFMHVSVIKEEDTFVFYEAEVTVNQFLGKKGGRLHDHSISYYFQHSNRIKKEY